MGPMGGYWFVFLLGGGIIWGGVALRGNQHPDLGGWIIALGWFATGLFSYVIGQMHGEREASPYCRLCGDKLLPSAAAATDLRHGKVHFNCHREEWQRLESKGVDPSTVMGPK
jgi:hypothetical protein